MVQVAQVCLHICDALLTMPTYPELSRSAPFFSSGSLFGPLPPGCFRQGLAYLHRERMIHRDVKGIGYIREETTLSLVSMHLLLHC